MTAAKEHEPPRVASPGPAPPVETWFDEAVPHLYGYFMMRLGGNVDLAEDLTQNTVIAAASARHGPAIGTPITAWLFGIARHKLMDHLRREERTRRRFGQRVESDVIAFEPAPSLGDLDIDAMDVRDAVARTLAELSPNQRAAIILRYFDGCDVATTADHLDLGIRATESLLARARRAFRSAYLRQGHQS